MKARSTHAQLQKEFRQIIERQLLPWATGDLADRLILAELPLRAPRNVKSMPYPLPPLHATGFKPTYFAVDSWPGIEMCCARFPQISVVLKGEGDFRIGTVGALSTVGAVSALNHGGARGAAEGQAVLLPALPEGIMLVFPAGVLQDQGRPHWFRPDPEKANCNLFHLQMIPEGIRCSMCSTVGVKHRQHGWLLCHDTQALGLADLLIEELRGGHLHSIELARHYLFALLLRAHRLLRSPSGVIAGGELRLFLKEEHAGEIAALAPESVFERASHYIHSHLHERLSLGSIAAHAYVAPRTLIRIFNCQASVPVMRYVLERRMESARFYLEHSSLPIAEIGRLVGYARSDQFGHAFTRHAGCPPSALRTKPRQRRRDVAKRSKKAVCRTIGINRQVKAVINE